MDEFELISRYFDRKRKGPGVSTGIGDDGAVLVPGDGLDQVQVIDTLVAGVHFPIDTNASDIAFRAVAVNLSDVAAMGARPRWMTLALTLSDNSARWLESFAAGLFTAADEHEVELVGGDTTRGPATVVTVSITAEVERGAALLRSGAQSGDTIFVTGTLGDAAAGLKLLQGGKFDESLVTRFLRPTARIATGRALVGKAHAAIDISDGFAGDLKKLLRASGKGARIDIEKLPISHDLGNHFKADEQRHLALTGGDDYELCFTADAESVAHIPGITAVGLVSEAQEIEFFHRGDVVEVNDSGYRHFQ